MNVYECNALLLQQSHCNWKVTLCSSHCGPVMKHHYLHVAFCASGVDESNISALARSIQLHTKVVHLSEHDGYLFRDVHSCTFFHFMKWQTFVVILYTFPAISMCDESWLNHLYNYLFWISPSFSASDRNSLAINSGNYSGHWNQEPNPRWKIMENPCSNQR